MSVIIVDTEVLRLADQVEGGWDNPAGMGFGTAVTYNYKDDNYKFWLPQQQELCEEYLKGHKVVSFNGIRFDNAVILGSNDGPVPWKDIDLLSLAVCSKFETQTIAEAVAKVGTYKVFDSSMGLDAICQATIGKGKNGHGALAPAMIKSGQWAAVFEYNLGDVRLTRQLFEFVGQNGYLIDGKGNKIAINLKRG